MLNPIISADSHVSEPPNCYLDHIDKKFGARVPRLQHDDKYGDVFRVEGSKQPIPISSVSTAGKKSEELSATGAVYKCVHHPWKPAHDRVPVAEAPTGIGVFLEEVIRFPCEWAERHYNLQHWTTMQSGGRFAPMEEPQALIDDLRKFYRPMRARPALARRKRGCMTKCSVGKGKARGH